VSGTMDAVRARLAPIRGIPTKQGNLQDPNSVSLAGKARPVLLPRGSSCLRRLLVHAQDCRVGAPNPDPVSLWIGQMRMHEVMQRECSSSVPVFTISGRGHRT
jgi:hypothetical protein